MRIIGLCVLLLTSCIFAQDKSKELIQPATDLETLFGFTEEKMKTPDSIPSDQLPELDVYNINARIIIEGQVTEVTVGDEQITAMWWAADLETIRRDLKNAEEIFKDVSIKFHISEVAYREFNPDFVSHFMRAFRGPKDIMTVTYMLPNAFHLEGYSAAPWEPVNRGIVIRYQAGQWTLAHEIGHYFGLLHPFEEDYVDDTLPQKMKYCVGEEHRTENCHNLMNYCNHEPMIVTEGQIERFRRFLRAKRINHYVADSPDMMLKNSKFPSPAGTTVIFNMSDSKASPIVESTENP